MPANTLPHASSAPEPTFPSSSTTSRLLDEPLSPTDSIQTNPFVLPGQFPYLPLLEPDSSNPAPVLIFGIFNPSSIEYLRKSGLVLALSLSIWLCCALGYGFLGVMVIYLAFSRYLDNTHEKLLRKLRLEAEYFATFRRAQLNAEPADWFNLILAKFWVAYEPTLSASIKGSLEPILEYVCPAFIDSLKFDHFSLGTFPPQLRSIVSARNTSDDIIDLQFDLSFGSFGPFRDNQANTQNEDTTSTIHTTKTGMSFNSPPLKTGTSVYSINTTGEDSASLSPSTTHNHDQPPQSPTSETAHTSSKPEYLPVPIQTLTNSRVDLVVRIRGIALTVRAENVTVEGQMRVRMKLINTFPHVQVLELWFLDAPKIGFELRPLGGMDLNAVKMIRRWLDETIAGAVSAHLVYPNPLVLPFEEMLNKPELETDVSIGVLVVHIKNAVGLRNADLIGKSDPFLGVLIANRQVAKTAVMSNNLNPFWDEVKYAIVTKLVDNPVKLAVYDFDKTGRNKLLGAVEVDLSQLDIVNGGTHPSTEFDLFDNERRHGGKLRATISFHPILATSINSPTLTSYGSVASSSLPESEVSSPQVSMAASIHTVSMFQPEIPSGILKVTCHAARGLENGAKLRSPFVYVAYNGETVHTTRTKKHSNSPIFDESFEIFVLDKRAAQLHFTVRDDVFNALGKPDPLLGHVTVSVAHVLRTKKTKDDWYSLVEGARDAKLRMTMKWWPVPLKRESAQSAGGVLRIRVGQCYDLKSSLGSSKINPYVRLLSGDKLKSRSRRLTDTANPDFNDSLFVLVRDPTESISLQVWDYSRALKDTLIGTALVSLSKYVTQAEDGRLQSTGAAYETLDLAHVSHIKPRGKLSAEISFHPKRPDMPFTPEQHHVSGIMKCTVHLVKDLPRKLNTFFEVFSDDPGLCLYRSPIKKKSSDPIFEQSVEIFIRQVYYSSIQIVIREEGGAGPAGMPGDVAVAAAKTISNIGASGQAKAALVLGTYESYAYTEVCAGLHAERWCTLNNSNGAKIKLSFEFVPLDLAILDPSESLSNMGMLELEVIGARELPKADQMGLCDAFCVVLLDDQRWLKTAVQRKTLSPVWKELVKIPVLNRFRSTLKFQVWDWDKIGANEYLAGAELNLAEIETNNQTRLDIPLLDSTGVLTISYRFQSKRMEKIPSRYLTMTRATLDRFDPRKKRRNSHSSMSSLRPSVDTSSAISFGTEESIPEQMPLSARNNDSSDGLPKSTSLDFGSNSSLNTYVDEHTDKILTRGALTVTVVQANNLIAVDHDGFSDPYVKIKCSTPGISGNVVKFVTKTIQNNLNPVWDEVFTAPLPKHALTSDHVPVKCTLYDSNRMHQDILIGSFEFNLWDLIMDRILNDCYTLDPRGTGWIHLQLDSWLTLKLDVKATTMSTKRNPNQENDGHVNEANPASRVRVQFAVLLPPSALKTPHPQRPLPPGMEEFVKETDGDQWREEIVFPTSLALSPTTTSPENAAFFRPPTITGSFFDREMAMPSFRPREPSTGSDQASITSGKSIKSRISGFKKVFSRKEKEDGNELFGSAEELYKPADQPGPPFE